MLNAFEITTEDVANVLVEMGHQEDSKNENLVKELHGDLNYEKITIAALRSNDLEIQTNYAYEVIMEQLKKIYKKKDLTKAYLKKGGICCLNPDCLSDDIEGGFIETDTGGAWQKITCNECGWTWTDVYKLSTVTNIEEV